MVYFYNIAMHKYAIFMNIVFVRNLLTIPQAWRVSRGFLTKATISIFFVFSPFFVLFHIKVIGTKNLSLPDLQFWHVHRVMFDSIRRHFAYYIIRIIGPAESGT